ncbi:MAG: putative methyltransferase [Phenylobacterium sp.]|jgi:predicted methyltransferase
MKRFFNPILAGAVLFMLLLTACSDAQKPQDSDHLVGETLHTAVSHPDRPANDKQRDNHRKPAQVLSFLGVRPGMTVLEIMSGRGYYTELLSRVVGQQGKVYSHNDKLYYDFQSDKFVEQRLNNNRLSNVLRWDKELDNLNLPANEVDAVFLMLVFHDMYWMDTDTDQLLNDIYKALKPGGTVGIVDHSAVTGSGDHAAKDMHGIHRIDEALVKAAFAKAGFKLVRETNLLRNPDDDRSKPFFDSSLIDQPTDRFVLRYQKPPLESQANPSKNSPQKLANTNN